MSNFHTVCRMVQPKKRDAGYTVVGEQANRFFFVIEKEAGEASKTPGARYWRLVCVFLDGLQGDDKPRPEDRQCREDYGVSALALERFESQAYREICGMFRPKNPDANYTMGGSTALRRYFLFPRYKTNRQTNVTERSWDLAYVEESREADPFAEPTEPESPPLSDEDDMPF